MEKPEEVASKFGKLQLCTINVREKMGLILENRAIELEPRVLDLMSRFYEWAEEVEKGLPYRPFLPEFISLFWGLVSGWIQMMELMRGILEGNRPDSLSDSNTRLLRMSLYSLGEALRNMSSHPLLGSSHTEGEFYALLREKAGIFELMIRDFEYCPEMAWIFSSRMELLEQYVPSYRGWRYYFFAAARPSTDAESPRPAWDDEEDGWYNPDSAAAPAAAAAPDPDPAPAPAPAGGSDLSGSDFEDYEPM